MPLREGWTKRAGARARNGVLTPCRAGTAYAIELEEIVNGP